MRKASNVEKRLQQSMVSIVGFSGGSVIENPPASAGDESSVSCAGRSAGEGNGHPLQCSCLQTPLELVLLQKTGLQSLTRLKTTKNVQYFTTCSNIKVK